MYIANLPSLKNSTIISAGSGEDLTFDIELINKYNCKIILIDPTPRAVEYFKLVQKRFGKNGSMSYSNSGYENPKVYDLRRVNESNISLVDKALYNCDNKNIKFFAPPDEKHVSYSITNWRGNYSKNSPHIVVKSLTIGKIIKDFKIENLSLVKLDIEGAENKVLLNMLKNNNLPDQIAVEFSDLFNEKLIPIIKFVFVFIYILSKRYKLINLDRYPNLLFTKYKI